MGEERDPGAALEQVRVERGPWGHREAQSCPHGDSRLQNGEVNSRAGVGSFLVWPQRFVSLPENTAAPSTEYSRCQAESPTPLRAGVQQAEVGEQG